MKRFFVFSLSFLVGIFLFIWVIRLVGWSKIKLALFALTGIEGIIIFFLTVLIIAAATLRWRIILKDQGYNIPFFTLFRLYCFDHSLNFLVPILPFGGEVFRAYFLKEKNNLPLKIAASSAIIDGILEITSHLIIAFLGVIYFVFQIGFPPRKIATIIFGALFASLFLLSFFYFKSFKKESLISFFLKKFKNNSGFEIEKELFDFFNFKTKKFWKGLVLAFLRDGISLLRTFVLLIFLGKIINFFSSLSIFSFSILAQLFPIPAFLGSHDLVQVFVFRSLGLKIAIAAAFALIIRGADFLLAILGILAVSDFGAEYLKKIIFNNKN